MFHKFAKSAFKGYAIGACVTYPVAWGRYFAYYKKENRYVAQILILPTVDAIPCAVAWPAYHYLYFNGIKY